MTSGVKTSFTSKVFYWAQFIEYSHPSEANPLITTTPNPHGIIVPLFNHVITYLCPAKAYTWLLHPKNLLPKG